MHTRHDTAGDRSDRRLAQLLAAIGVLAALVALVWDSGLASFLLALAGLALVVRAVAMTPDGWLVDQEDE